MERITPQNGFTLVELAIVLMIIGLLVGGILRGQELMNNAKVGALVKQVSSYDAAVNTFLDSYSAYPGDLATAQSRLANCTTSGSSCANGNGDGMVGPIYAPWDGGQHLIGTENTQFWKHLALSHLISGIDPSASTPNWSKSQPYSPYNGGFSVVQTFGTSGSQGGLILRLHGCLTCSNVEQDASASDGSPLSPKTGWQIDRKMDDGIPNTGQVQAAAYPQPGRNEADCEVAYKVSDETNFCVMNFSLHR